MSIALEVLATGARTPVGLTAESSAAAVRAGILRGREFPFISPSGEPVVVAADALLAPTCEGRARMLPMLASVLDEVMRKLSPHRVSRCPGYVWLTLPESRPGFDDSDAAWLADKVRTKLAEYSLTAQVEITGRGHAGTLHTIGRAAQLSLRQEDALFVICGVDSYLHPKTFSWLEQDRRFKQASIRSGFLPGEAAGCLVLASSNLRVHLRAQPLASVQGIGTAQETLLRESETGSLGVAMTAAVRDATAGLVLSHEAADALYLDLNGERYRSEEWGFVALRVPEAFRQLTYQAPSDCWGDVGAAFGTLASNLAVQSFTRRYAPGPRALVLAGSDGGQRGALLLQSPLPC